MVREGRLPPGAAGHERGAPAGLAGGSAKVVVDDDRRMVGQPHPTVLPIDLGAHGGARETRGGQVVVEDRKSTRLNSSHVATSYAVLCLKEKPQHKITKAIKQGIFILFT